MYHTPVWYRQGALASLSGVLLIQDPGQVTAGAEASTVTFSIQGDGTEPPRDFLRITKLTGSNREVQATRAGRIILRRQPEIIYTAELLEANSGWEYGLTEDEVREAFNLITTEWTAGDS